MTAATPFARCLTLAAWLGATLATGAQAVELPRWEFGLGPGLVSVPDYRGSDERRQFAVATPFLIYRGDTIKTDREGTRAQLWGADNMHLDFYFGGNLPVSSARNQARAGMPGFKGSLDIGPALDIRLSESADQLTVVKLRLPLSYGFTLGKSQQSLGWQTAPTLNIYNRNTFGWQGLSASMRTGPIFATRQRNGYFYDVPEQYATATRPAYEASAGYAGWQLGATLSKRFERVWVGAFARYDNLSRTAFHDSPLVRTHHYTMGGVALIWVLGESAERVNVE
ncbi:MAG: hypothetical protein RI907_2550 [Pseudomonadota bacterium]|jgi:outer membrane scaffolding protein for murein synthesis (MipA/OmpV family)